MEKGLIPMLNPMPLAPEGTSRSPHGDMATTLDATRQRWQVLYKQLRSGHEPCYGSERRLVCNETGCSWRAGCTAMRAQWRR
jgi:hypothetical protein